MRPSDVGGCEYPEWAWWSGGTFVHKVGIESEIFGVSGCGTPRFLVWVVGGGVDKGSGSMVIRISTMIRYGRTLM